MKNLRNKISVLVLTLLMTLNYSLNAQSTKDRDYVETELRKGMASFVDGVRSIHTKGMSYEEFRIKLVGNDLSKNVTKEGNDLLNKAFDYVSSGTSSKEIINSGSVKEIAAAVFFVREYNDKNRSSHGDAVLFGSVKGGDDFPENSAMSAKRNCKWYQIGCHLSNIWDWIKENWETVIAILTAIGNL